MLNGRSRRRIVSPTSNYQRMTPSMTSAPPGAFGSTLVSFTQWSAPILPSILRWVESSQDCQFTMWNSSSRRDVRSLTAHSSISILQVYLSHTWLNFKYTSSILDTSILRQDCLKYTWSIRGSSILVQVFFKYTSSLLGQVRTSPSILQVYLKLSWRNK